MGTAFAITLLLVGQLNAHAATAEKPAKSSPELTQEDREKLNFDLLNALLRSSRSTLKGRKHCEEFVRGRHQTVGRFIAFNLSYFGNDKANSVQSTCERNQNSKSCTVNFNADSKGESPWSCGFRFDYDSVKKRIDLSTLECVGTC